MQKLIQGLHHFQNNIFTTQRELFARLAKGQSPETLFITCSDSRINPNLITQTDPGDLFILRNAGNLVPPFGAPGGGEAATIEFAVAGLGVKNIIVCGHSHCGAMKSLFSREELEDKMPSMAAWLNHAEATRRIILDNYAHLEGEDRLTATVEENVLIQIENLRTHPAVASRLVRGALNLHAWVYKIETGTVFAFDAEQEQYVPVQEAPQPAVAPRTAMKPPI